MKLKAQGVFNGDKANPNIRHKYVVNFAVDLGDRDKKNKPVMVRNRELDEKDQVYVICDHLLAAEREQYFSSNSKGRGYADFANVVKNKVRSLHNLDHPEEDRQMTIDEVLDAYGSPMAQQIVQDIAVHLLITGDLDEGEIKN